MCRHIWLDVQSLTKVPCDCAGFRPVEGDFRDATFAQDEDQDLELRLV